MPGHPPDRSPGQRDHNFASYCEPDRLPDAGITCEDVRVRKIFKDISKIPLSCRKDCVRILKNNFLKVAFRSDPIVSSTEAE
jgi:hypothetical protein